MQAVGYLDEVDLGDPDASSYGHSVIEVPKNPYEPDFHDDDGKQSGDVAGSDVVGGQHHSHDDHETGEGDAVGDYSDEEDEEGSEDDEEGGDVAAVNTAHLQLPPLPPPLPPTQIHGMDTGDVYNIIRELRRQVDHKASHDEIRQMLRSNTPVLQAVAKVLHEAKLLRRASVNEHGAREEQVIPLPESAPPTLPVGFTSWVCQPVAVGVGAPPVTGAGRSPPVGQPAGTVVNRPSVGYPTPPVPRQPLYFNHNVGAPGAPPPYIQVGDVGRTYGVAPAGTGGPWRDARHW